MLCSIKHRERRLKIDTFPTRNRQIIHIGSTSVIKHCRWCGSGKETQRSSLLLLHYRQTRIFCSFVFSSLFLWVVMILQLMRSEDRFFHLPSCCWVLPCHLHRVCLTHLCQRRPEKEIWRDYELVTGKCELHDDGSSSDYEARWL